MYFSIRDYVFNNSNILCKTRKNLNYLLIIYLILLRLKYNIDIPMRHININDLRYFPPDIIDKILSKKIPFKLHKTFEKYNNKDLSNENTYKDFCNPLL